MSCATERKDSRQVFEPAVWIFVGVVLLAGVAVLSQLYLNEVVYPVDRLRWGHDFRFFHNAGRFFLEGISPYQEPLFTSPPTTAMFFGVLGLLPLSVAYPLFFVATVVFCFLGIWMLFRHVLPETNAVEQQLMFIVTAAALLLGLPFQFLIDRGNTDGLIFILVVCGFVLLHRYPAVAGGLIGLAAILKIYPLLLLLPLVVMRKWRAVFVATALIIALAAMTPSYWGEWLTRIVDRDSGFRIDENGSLANTVAHVIFAVKGYFRHAYVAPSIKGGMVIFVVLLSTLLLADFRRRGTKHAAMVPHLMLYLPLMVSFPNLVYTYELIFVLGVVPGICWFWRYEPQLPRMAFVLLILGAALSQLHASALRQMWDAVFPHAFPSVGLLLMSIGAVWIKFASRISRQVDAVGNFTPGPSVDPALVVADASAA